MTEEKTVPATTYREIIIGGTVYRVTSVYLGEKDLKTALEQLTVRRVLAELTTGKPA
jgi:hypothetical protein